MQRTAPHAHFCAVPQCSSLRAEMEIRPLQLTATQLQLTTNAAQLYSIYCGTSKVEANLLSCYEVNFYPYIWQKLFFKCVKPCVFVYRSDLVDPLLLYCRYGIPSRNPTLSWLSYFELVSIVIWHLPCMAASWMQKPQKPNIYEISPSWMKYPYECTLYINVYAWELLP